jgi:hypothetical protein
MGETMKITGQLNQKDYLQATLLHYKSNVSVLVLFFGILIIFGLTSIIGILFVILQKIPFSFILPVLGVLISTLAIRYLLIPFQIANTFNKRKDLSEPITYEFDGAHISSSALTNQSSRPWSDICEIKENKDICLLYFGLNCFYIIPKRFFTSPEDMEKMRSWVYESPVIKPNNVGDRQRTKLIVSIVIFAIIVFLIILVLASYAS